MKLLEEIVIEDSIHGYLLFWSNWENRKKE